jgi:hypothetical protein
MKPQIEPDRQRNPELPLAVNETPNGAEGRPPLLPVRYPDPDLFICDVLDAIPKDDMASMEHPIFSLATKPDRRVFRYEHNGNKLEIVPSVKGLATIHDKDILIYCISQLIGKMNQGERPSRTLHLTARDLLVGPTGKPMATAMTDCGARSSACRGRGSPRTSRPMARKSPKGSASSTNGGSCGKPAPAKCRKSRSRSPIGCSRWSRGAVS